MEKEKSRRIVSKKRAVSYNDGVANQAPGVTEAKTAAPAYKKAFTQKPVSEKRAVLAEKIEKKRKASKMAASEKSKGANVIAAIVATVSSRAAETASLTAQDSSDEAGSALASSSDPKPGLVRSQVEKAVLALCAHLDRTSSGSMKDNVLLGDAAQIFMVLNTKQMPKELSGAKTVKPVRLDLPHPWRSLDTTEVGLIVKAPQRTVKDRLAAQGASGIKVIGIDKLKKKYLPFEAKRKLRAVYDLMLADDRIVPQLPSLLGSDFFKSNKLPLPIDLRKHDLAGEIKRCVGSAILRPTRGTCCSLVIANSTQPHGEIVTNVLSATEQVVQRLKGRWGNVQGVHLRAANSIALPLYAST